MDPEADRPSSIPQLTWSQAELLHLLVTENEKLRARARRKDSRYSARVSRQAHRVRWRVGRRLRPSIQKAAASLGVLFDDSFYLQTNPDVEEHGIDPLLHFLKIGWREGRDPNPLFDTDWYATENQLNETTNPLLHYIREGAAAGCDPGPWFSTEWYQSHARVPANVPALTHYLVTGHASRVSPSAAFDAERYLLENPDVASGNQNPLSHFVSVGRIEGRVAHSIPITEDGAGVSDSQAGEMPTPSYDAPELHLLLSRYAPLLAERLTYPDRLPGRPHFMTVLIRTQGRRINLLSETLLCLAAQENQDFEVLLVAHDADLAGLRSSESLVTDFRRLSDAPIRLLQSTGGTRGRPIVEGMLASSGRYCVVLDDDDHITADWVSGFAAAEADRPGAVLRCGAVSRYTSHLDHPDGDIRVASGAPRPDYCAAWSLRGHVMANGTPIHAYATPSWIRTELGLVINESLTVVEDWDYLIRAAMVCGVADISRVTAIYNRGGDDSAAAVAHYHWRSHEDSIRAATLRHPVIDRWLT